MKKQIFTNTILYTRNTLVPVTKENIAVSNQFGKLLNNRYEYNIIWVPENAHTDGSVRQIQIMPQYKFGHSDNENLFIDARNNLDGPVIVEFGAQNTSSEFSLESISDQLLYTDNIMLNLLSTFNDQGITINSKLSNYSTVISASSNNFFYNLAFRLVISIYNITTNTVEDTIYSYITNARFGRSSIQKPGTPPNLPWDIDVHGVMLAPGTPFASISTEPSVLTAFSGQIGGDYGSEQNGNGGPL